MAWIFSAKNFAITYRREFTKSTQTTSQKEASKIDDKHSFKRVLK